MDGRFFTWQTTKQNPSDEEIEREVDEYFDGIDPEWEETKTLCEKEGHNYMHGGTMCWTCFKLREIEDNYGKSG